jgi:hypothetical protein
LSRAPERERVAPPAHFERSEDPEIHVATAGDGSHGTPPREGAHLASPLSVH